MLKFINENDFLLVNEFKETEDGSVNWVYDEGEGLPTHSGFIRQGMTRPYSSQTGTETVVVGQDENGDNITEEQPVFEEITVNVWDKLKELEADGTITIEPYVQSYEEQRQALKQQRQALKQQRDTALENMTYDCGGGRVVQIRPSDLMNFQVAIEAGVDREWILADNSIATITVQEMIDAVESGKSQATAIFDNHITALQALES